MFSSESESASSPPPPPKKSKSSSSSSSKKRKNDLGEIQVDLNLPEPPSKKAKRALKKGKPLPAKQDSDDGDGDATTNKNEDDKGEDVANKSKKEKERSPYGVWIGNLRFTVTKDDLRQWLVDNSGGALTNDLITRVHLPAAQHSRGLAAFENRGFAYVDLATYDAAVAAVALSETEWHRRKLLIKDAKSYEGRPKKVDAADKKEEEEPPQSTSRKVFVGNMSFQTTEDDLRALFSRCGEVEWAKVATFEDSGKCKGYGWVKFKEAAAADWAAKGFVKVKEVEETEEDFMDVDEDKGEEEEEKEDDDDDDYDDDDENDDDKKKKKKAAAAPKKKPQAKKVKMRKWWVNQLNGRRLKIEHAEDDQTRYKKRFGKNKDAQPKDGSSSNRPDQPRSRFNKDKRGGGDGSQSTPAEVSAYGSDINVARLTGAAVKPEGKKTTFD